MSMAIQSARPEHQTQVVVVLLELRGLLKHLWSGGSTEGSAFEELRDRAYGALSGYLRREGGPFRLGFALPEVLLGEDLLRGTRAAYEAAYELGRQLEELGGSELTVQAELTAAEFADVVAAIAKARGDFSEFTSPTPAFVLRASSDAHDLDDPESPEYVAQAYAASVVAMRRLFEELEGTAVLPPRAKRVGQGLVDLSGERLSLLVAAASAAGPADEPAGRAVNAAIYALALLRQISSDRRLLSHVAMAALFCDVGGVAQDDADPAALPARTVAALMSLGRLNEASVVRTVVAFEAKWLEADSGPVYAGRRRTTLAARVVRIVRSYQKLFAAHAEQSISERVDVLYMQAADEIDQLLVCAFAAGLQIPQPAASLDPVPSEEIRAAAASAAPAEESPEPSSVLEVVDSGWSMHPPPSELLDEAASAPFPAAAPLPNLDAASTPGPSAAFTTKPAAEETVAEPPAAPEPTAEAPAEPAAPAPTEEVLAVPAITEDVHAAVDEAPGGAPTAPPPGSGVPALAGPDEPAITPSAVSAARVPTAQGNLQSQPIPHVLLYVLDQGLTGTLVFEEPVAGTVDPLRHQVFLLEGAPAQARLALRTSRLGDVLARLNLVSASALESWITQAEAKVAEGEPRQLLGELLLSKSVLSREDLTRALEAQLVERLAALATLPKGTSYSFFANENLFADQPGANELLTTSPLNALFATLRGSVDEERMMATLRRIWRIPLAFHPDADREAYALTGEEESVLERIEHGRPTLDELLADRRVSRPAAVQFVYFLAVTRQLAWKGQKKGPIMPRGSRVKTGFSPPLPPRTTPQHDDRVLSGTQNTKPKIRVRILTPGGSRMVESGLPTPPVMQAVRLENIPLPAESEVDVDITVDEGDPERASSAPPASGPATKPPPAPASAPATAPPPPPSAAPPSEPPGAAAPEPSPSPLPALVSPRSQPPLEFEHPNIIDPGAALAALITGLRLSDEGDRDGASRSVRRASKLDPEEPEYAARLARLESSSELEAQLDRLHRAHPDHLVVGLEWARHKRARAQSAKAPARASLTEALEGYRSVLARDIAHVEAARCVFELCELLDEQP